MEIRIVTEGDIPVIQRIRLDVRENKLSDPSRIQPPTHAA